MVPETTAGALGAPGAATRVLIVDDDVELCELLSEYLRREGMEAQAVHDGEAGTRRAQSGEFAAVILDVMLPVIGGFEVLRRLRSTSTSARLPVLMLTARGDEVDRVLGLEIGADDYLPKPFSSRELVARLRAILRRSQSSAPAGESAPDGMLRLGDITLDASAREVKKNGARLDLTAAEFDLLEVLGRSAGRVVPREEIARRALGRPLLPFDRSIDVHVSNLRRKLGPGPDGAERIKAVRGTGYLFARASEGAGEGS